MVRSRRRARVRSALLAVALCFGCVVLTPTAANAASDDALLNFNSCLSRGTQGDLLVVLDTSGSLKDSDPDHDRVVATTYFLKRYLAQVDDAGVKLDVAIAGFADSFEVTRPWTTLDASTSAGLVDAVDGYREQNKGFETDYWSAVAGARKYLTAKNDAASPHCQAWLWFSDGGFNLNKRNTQAERRDHGDTKPYGPDVQLTSEKAEKSLEDAARTDLCRRGGLADQLRAQGILTLAIGLNSGGREDFALMQGIATGSAPQGGSCGTSTGEASGVFVLADQVQDLLFDIDSFDPDPQKPLPLCQGRVCPEGTHQFVLDATIAKVHILAGSDVSRFRVVLIGPAGERMTVEPGSPVKEFDERGYGARFEWIDGGALEIDLTRVADRGWVGGWRLAFVDPESKGNGTSRSNIHLYGDIEPAWIDARTQLTTGSKSEVRLALVRSGTTKPLDLTDVTSSVAIDAVLEQAGKPPVQLKVDVPKESLEEPWELDLAGVSPGQATLSLRLRLRTAPAKDGDETIPGTDLEPSAAAYPITVLAPAAYPSVPAELSFGATDQVGDHSGSLPVSGPGCAWLQGAAEPTTLPEGVSRAEVSSSADAADRCASGSLPLTLTLDQIGNGLVSGDLTVMTLPETATADTPPVPVTVRYTLETTKPRNDGVFAWLLVLITLGGVLVPIGLLYLLKWWTARIPGSSLLVGSVIGSIDAQGALALSSSLNERTMSGRTLTGTDRRSVALPGATIRTRMGLGLTEPGYAVVTGRPSASSARPATTRSGRAARLPLALQDSWVVTLDPTAPQHGTVEVTFLVSPTSQKLPELLADARERVPAVVADLRARLGSGAATAGDDDASPGSTDSGRRTGDDDWGTPGSSRSSTAGSPPSDPGGRGSSGDQW